MEERVAKLEREVEALKARNARVEAEKAWETSYARTFSIALVTYAAAALALFMVGVENYLLAALVPPLAYALSTQSLPAVKRRWIVNSIRKPQKA